MALDPRYDAIRTAINDCAGYRILDDEDVIEPGDETTRASTWLGCHEDWHKMKRDDPDWKMFFGRTVKDMNDPNHNDEMDVRERVFRRRLR